MTWSTCSPDAVRLSPWRDPPPGKTDIETPTGAIIIGRASRRPAGVSPVCGWRGLAACTERCSTGQTLRGWRACCIRSRLHRRGSPTRRGRELLAHVLQALRVERQVGSSTVETASIDLGLDVGIGFSWSTTCGAPIAPSLCLHHIAAIRSCGRATDRGVRPVSARPRVRGGGRLCGDR